nr:LuxR family regulator [Streptomyces sp.]
MGLAERHQHIQLLHRLTSDAASGRGRVAVLHGTGPNGKTELLDHAIVRAEELGFQVLRAVGARPERALPLGIVAQLVHGATLPGHLRREADTWLEEAAVTVTADSVPGTATVRIFDRLCRVMLELAGRAPVLIAVDDVHHADTASLHCLLHLIRRIGPLPVCVVLTDDSSSSTELPLFRGELQRQPYVSRLAVEPLGPAGVRELVAECLGAARADALAADFHRLTGGNTLLLSSLVEDFTATGGIRPQGYGAAFAGHLERGDRVCLAVVRALAVLGPERTTAELAELAEVSEAEVGTALGTLSGSGLLADGHFRAPAARLAVLEALSRTERDRLHLAAARLLHQRGAPVPRVAAHLVETQSAPGDWAVQALREAAERALVTDQRGTAVACLELAYRCCSEETARTAVLARLLHAEWLDSPSRAARHLSGLGAAAASGRLDRSERVTLVHRLLWHGRGEEAARVLHRLRATARAPQPGQRTDLLDLEHWLAWNHPELAMENRPQATAGTAPFLGVPSRSGPLPHVTGVLSDALTRGRPDRVTDLAEQILGDVPRARASEWGAEAALTALTVLTAADRPTDTLAWCERLVAEDVHLLPVTTRAFLAAARAEAALRLGELGTALEQARLAFVLLPAKSWGTAVGLPLGSLLLAAARTGEFEEVSRQLTQSVPDAMLESRYGVTYLYARGHCRLATGHSHAALADFMACGERMRAWGLDVPGLPAWRTGAAEAWLRLGNTDQAKKLAYEQLGRPDAARPHTRGLALRMMAAASPVKRMPQLLTEALDLFEECGDQYEQARVLADLSRAQYEAGDSRRARMLFRRARHMARLCGAEPLCEELLSAPEELGGEPPTRECGLGAGLTDAERRVAALAVRGYTNREIALKLYVTPSTVEQHLTRTYRKLGIKRRKDLPAGLGVETGASGSAA